MSEVRNGHRRVSVTNMQVARHLPGNCHFMIRQCAPPIFIQADLASVCPTHPIAHYVMSLSTEFEWRRMRFEAAEFEETVHGRIRITTQIFVANPKPPVCRYSPQLTFNILVCADPRIYIVAPNCSVLILSF